MSLAVEMYRIPELGRGNAHHFFIDMFILRQLKGL